MAVSSSEGIGRVHSSGNATRPDQGPGAQYAFLDGGTELLKAFNVKSEGGIFGVGMKIDMNKPYAVQGVSNLKDRDGGPINERVPVGDKLVAVDGVNIAQAQSSNFVKDLIWGDQGTTAVLTLLSNSSHQYNVEILRHIPVKAWETHKRWLQLRPEFAGESVLAGPKIVETLETIREALCGTDGYSKDMLRDDEGMTCRLGLKFYLEVPGSHPRPMAIAAITPGSPAAISGELQVDDEVVAVDGMQAFEINLTKLVGGSDVVGSKCTLTIRRGGRTFEVSIARTAEKRLGKIAQQQEMFAELLKIAKGTPSERLVTELTKFTAELENSRLKHEALLANKLWRAQAHVVEQVTFAESMLSVNTGGSGARISELENALKAMQSERDDLMRENCSLQSLLNESQARMIDALAELESMKERMAGMVSKSRLDALQDDYDRMLADNTNLRDHHKGMVSKERASAAESSQQGMLEECERLRAQMRDMVARTALEGAEEDTARLRAELERLRAKLSESVPELDYKAALENIEMLKGELERAHAGRDAYVPASELDAARAEVETLRAHLERLRTDKTGMIPIVELDWAKEENSALLTANAALKARVDSLTEELDALKLRTQDSVPRSDLVRSQADLRGVQALLDQKTQDLNSAETLVEDLRAKLAQTTQESKRLSNQLEGMSEKQLLREALADSDRYRADADTFRRELAGADHQLAEVRTENSKVRKQLQDALKRLEEVVERSELMTAKSEAAALREDLRSAMAAEQAAERFSAELNLRNAELREEVERLKTIFTEMVPRHDLKEANDRAISAQDEANALRLEVEMLRTWGKETNEKLLALRTELERLKSEVADMVAREVLMQALEKLSTESHRAQQAEADAAQSANDLGREVATSATQREELQELRAKMMGMASAADLRAAQVSVAQLKDEAAHHEAEAVRLKAQHEEDTAAARALKEELAKLQAQLLDMVPTKDLQEALREAADYKARAQEEHDRLEAAQKSIATLQETLTALRAELDSAKQQLLNSVPRDAFLEAQKQVKDALARVSEMEGAVVVAENTAASVQEKLAEARTANEEMRAELITSVSRDKLLAAQAESKGYEGRAYAAERERDDLESSYQALLARLTSLTQEGMDARAAMAEMVAKEMLTKADSDARTAQVEAAEARSLVEAAETNAKDARERLKGMVSAEDLRKAKQEAYDARDELQRLKKMLAEAGLSDQEVLRRLLDVIQGPSFQAQVEPSHLTGLIEAARTPWVPMAGLEEIVKEMALVPVTPADMCALLRALAGPPARSVADARRFLEIAAIAPALSARDFARLRNALQGPPEVPLADLEEMLKLCPSLSELKRLLERNAALEHKVGTLQERVAELQNEVRELRARLCPAPEEHAAYAGLKGKIAAIAAPQPPFFAPPACEFLGHLGLLLFGKPDVTIFYTLDGSEPTADNYAACGGSPLSIDLLSNTRVTARCIDAEGISGPTDTHAYAFTGATQSSRGGGRREAGLGMLLERSHGSEETTIKGLVEGGAADIDGRIQVGDTILRLGGREVRTISLRGLETLCAGKEGSQAQMVLRRAPNNVRNGLEQDDDRVYRVTMERTFTPNLQSHKMTASISSLSGQLSTNKQLLSTYIASHAASQASCASLSNEAPNPNMPHGLFASATPT